MMRRTAVRNAWIGLAGLTILLAGCPKAPKVPGRPGMPSDPTSCGDISGMGEIGRKLNAFLNASADLDAATGDLENTVKDACTKMAGELGIPVKGDTKELCEAVADALKNSLKVGIKSKNKFKVTYTPAQCTVKAELGAKVAAECEAKAESEIKVSCDGQCGGRCDGKCDGKCAAKNADGSCAGQCDGQCDGRCSGECRGSARTEASAECRAAADVKANLAVDCSEPKVDVEFDKGVVIDLSAIEKAKRALEVGLPTLLSATARARAVFEAAAYWATTAAKLASESKNIVSTLGVKGACVAGRLTAAAKAAASINVKIEVSVSASASVGGAAGGSAGGG